MNRSFSVWRVGVAVAVSVQIEAACAPDARAATPDKSQCLASYEQGQRLRIKGQFIRAREELVVCSNDLCPTALRPDCVKWLDELDRITPSVIVVARDAEGAEVLDVEIREDNQILADQLDGRALRLDPGVHMLRFTRRGASIDQRVILHEGESSVPVEVQFFEAPNRVAETSGETQGAAAVSSPTARASAQRPIPSTVYGAAGVAAVALASFMYFGISGRNEQSNVLEACRSRCTQDDVDQVRTKYLVADLSLAVAVVAAATSAVLFIMRPDAGGASRATMLRDQSARAIFTQVAW